VAGRAKEPVLADDEVGSALADGGPGWALLGGSLVKTVVCAGFTGALAFVGAVGALAEEADHHPDIDIRYNRVTLALVTHDSGGITRLDLDLARAIDEVEVGVAPGP
jgi:4a-hydroxytetrahydrobiopterin dehydratase